ncbi:MAG TPA: glycosyltransferase 87 family protein, partial [Gemmatimonadales bacterium]
MAGRARHWILALYLASAVFVTVQQGVVGRSNNFKVFRAAAVNLLAHRDLYAAHPDQHFDFYKYSPSFALLFAPFAALPFAAALLIWSLLNSLLLWYAVRRLLPDRQATLALALVYLEVLFAMQYTQSNGLVTALILLAFLALEQGR